MQTRRSSRLRTLGILAWTVALLVPAGAAEAKKSTKKAKKPVVTSIRPMTAEVGDTITVHGKYFRPGKAKNTVVFRRDGSKAIFVKADIATRRMIKVIVPPDLVEFMANRGTDKLATQFRVRILSTRFGKRFTTKRNSPMIGPDTPPAEQGPPSASKPAGDCDGDGIRNDDETDDDADGLSDEVELSLQLDPCKVDTDEDGLEDRWEFDCDRDGRLNRDQEDDDRDLLPDADEAKLMTDPCKADSDDDGVEDGYEFRSALDLNDDEYQQPNQSLPYPYPRPYANPLVADADVDYDGDGLSLAEEQALWKYTYEVNGNGTRNLDALSYSDGLSHSAYERCSDATTHPYCRPGTDNNRRVPTLKADEYAKWFGTGTTNKCAGSPCNEEGFLTWAERNGYRMVWLSGPGAWWAHAANRFEFDLLDANRDGDVSNHFPGAGESYGDLGVPASDEMGVLEATMFDLDADGYVSDDERDEDADGLTNYDETHGRMQPEYWAGCYPKEKSYTVSYAGTSHVNADSDGDGVRDGADDQDHDDVPNVQELSRVLASGLDDTEDGVLPTVGPPGAAMRTCIGDEDLPKPPDMQHPDAFGWVQPFNPCLPSTESRTCQRHPRFDDAPAPFADSTPIWHSLN